MQQPDPAFSGQYFCDDEMWMLGEPVGKINLAPFPHLFLSERASPAAQRLQEIHLIGRAQRVCQIEHLFAVDEKPHVPPHPVLLVNHAEFQSRVVTVEVGEQFDERRAAGFDLPLFGVRSAGWGE